MIITGSQFFINSFINSLHPRSFPFLIFLGIKFSYSGYVVILLSFIHHFLMVEEDFIQSNKKVIFLAMQSKCNLQITVWLMWIPFLLSSEDVCKTLKKIWLTGEFQQSYVFSTLYVAPIWHRHPLNIFFQKAKYDFYILCTFSIKCIYFILFYKNQGKGRYHTIVLYTCFHFGMIKAVLIFFKICANSKLTE